MRIAIILDKSNQGWIIEKMAVRLVDQLKLLGHFAELLTSPKQGFDVVHWMHYLNSSLDNDALLNSMMVTHIDEANKLLKFRKQIKSGVIPIFLSKDHANSIAKMLGIRESFDFVYPGSDLASNDVDKLRFVITSHVYPDKRKNENFLIRLSRELDLSGCEFILCGKRWSRIAKHLEKSGARVSLFSPELGNYPEYADLLKIVRQSDIFLYMGFDEGAMGALDAYLMGKKLIVSNQGFHTEFVGENVKLFSSYVEFAGYIRDEIKLKLAIKDSQSTWSWGSYALSHLHIWESHFVNSGTRNARGIENSERDNSSFRNERSHSLGSSGLLSFQGISFIMKFLRTKLKREFTRLLNQGRNS